MHDFLFTDQSPVDDENGEENDAAAADLLPVKVYYSCGKLLLHTLHFVLPSRNCMPHTASRRLKLLQHDNENNNSTNMISSLS